MIDTLHYLIHGTWLGILVLILLFIGLTLISFSQISLHKSSAHSGTSGTHSHQVIGCGFIVAAILVVLITWYLGKQPITSEEYEQLVAESEETPAIKPYLQAYLAQHPVLTEIDYHRIEREFEALKKASLTKELEGNPPIQPSA